MSAFISLVAVALLLNPFAPPQQTPSPSLKPDTVIGLHVPWAIGGEVIELDGTLNTRDPEWPDIAVNGIRLWDTRTAWLNLEPRQDLWDFTNLDAHLAQAANHGVSDITLVLWGTPKWAASRLSTNDAHWLGAGSASMPTNIDDWKDYVRTITQRYKGQISAYEIGNEPNVTAFWNGTDHELATLVRVATEIIHDTDPNATVVAPAPVVISSNPLQQRSANSFWPLLTHSENGDPLEENQQVDALSFHWYPDASTKPRELANLVQQLREQARLAGLEGLPLWLTEVNFYKEGLSAKQQQRKVEKTNDIIKQLKIPRTYWYAWTDLGPQTLMQFQSGSPAAKGLSSSLGHRNTRVSPN